MSAAEIGPMITVYAWVVALTSLPAMLLLAQVERPRWLMAISVNGDSRDGVIYCLYLS
ncbi:MAG: DHA1 family L-arabinose/isopropyl-beta-D-thiogalactopyranoside export protein-like MFS transporter [Shewanella sp.]|jgi:DHA1 family L-arabinose/isopropyl-beta-D-thiogalactopyranoside export protein-like MFS transporter